MIEVMVSVSIFAIIMTVGIGSLLTMNNAYRKSQSERVAIDNASFALESMARELRTGSNYSCLGSCTAGSYGIKFLDQDGDTIVYEFDSGNRIVKTDPLLGGQLALTDPAFVTINDLTFFVVGEDNNDSLQPYVIITLKATASTTNQQSQFTLQTAVSQRLLDRPLVLTP